MGFASGVMIAASVWSLIIPAIEHAESLDMNGIIPAVGGFILGVIFLLIFDKIIGNLSSGKLSGKNQGTTLLISAVTLHNIPEGIAVGLSFALVAQSGTDIVDFAPAIALAIGIGIQNFPEGAAVSLPLKQSGVSTGKSFLLGSLSGIVEPIFGILSVLIYSILTYYLPWLLSFAAGAMMFVVVKELIPIACDVACDATGNKKTAGTIGTMVGFLIMMTFDVVLG